MTDENTKSLSEIELDRNGLYREETYTDLRAGSIQVLTPVKQDGSPDDSRTPLFVGEAHLMSPSGPLPVRCEIQARTLSEALDKYPDAVNAAVDRMIEQAREMQRQEASRIVTPGEVANPSILLK
ncbi:MAG: hypothetical protein ABI333_16950 [bacterium]